MERLNLYFEIITDVGNILQILWNVYYKTISFEWMFRPTIHGLLTLKLHTKKPLGKCFKSISIII